MEIKNKLYCHHKSKISFIFRNFSLAFVGIFVLFSAVTIPTYFSIRGEEKVPTQASEEISDNKVDEKLDNSNENSEEEEQILDQELLNY